MAFISPFSNRGLISGTVIANPKGFGFVSLDKGGKDLEAFKSTNEVGLSWGQGQGASSESKA